MKKLYVSSSPHITGKQTTQKIMFHVIIALMPAVIASILIFGLYPLISIILCVISCVLAEFLFNLITKRKQSIDDLSAVVTGMILALNLPAVLPLYIPVVGGFFAILIVKMLFGGIGKNFANPAATARVFLLLAWTASMTAFVPAIDLTKGGYDFVKYFSLNVDAVTSATPLSFINKGDLQGVNLLSLFLGTHGGSAGEVSAIAILIGGVYLTAVRVIDVRIPITVLGTIAVFSWIFYGSHLYILPSLLSGGAMLGAFFMATDYSTSPNTTAGKLIFAFGIGFLTVLFRKFSAMPEGMSFAIIIMNITVPLMDKYIRPRIFGAARKKREKRKSV